jgi:TolB-like protein
MRALLLVPLLLLARAAHAGEPTIAVVYFDYDGKDDELGTLRKGLTQMLITDLAGREAYKVVERARLQELLAELNLSKTQRIDPSTQLKLGKLLQAKFVVMGSYLTMLGSLRIDARIVEVESTRTVKGVGVTIKPDDFFTAEQDLARQIDEVIVAEFAKEAKATPKRIAPVSLAKSAHGRIPLSAVKVLSKALDLKDEKKVDAAKAELDALVKANPDFLLARIELHDLAL